MSRNLPYGYDAPEPEPSLSHTHTEEEEVVEHEHTEVNLGDEIVCDTLVADEYVKAPEIHVGDYAITQDGGYIKMTNLETTLLQSGMILVSGALSVAGESVNPAAYAHKTAVTAEIAGALDDYREFYHLSETADAVVANHRMEVPSLNIEEVELTTDADGHLNVAATLDVQALQIDGVVFDMVGHNTTLDEHGEFFEGVEMTDDPGDPDTKVYVWSVDHELRSLDEPAKTTRNAGILRVNDHFSVHEPGRKSSIQSFYNASTERPGIVHINVPWVSDANSLHVDPDDCVVPTGFS
jgi:hypothetical protein